MVRINSLSELTGCEIYGKCEFMNPGGSVKDRMAKRVIMNALKDGKLSKGGKVYEGTVGSTGISLAMVSMSLGLKAHIFMPDD